MRRKLVLCALLLAPVLAFGQPSTAGVNTERPRSSYDPGASLSAKGQQQSGVAAALEKINPQDKDYGQVIDQARIALFEQTVEDFYWRSCMVLTVLLILSLMYIVWLWRERDLRLNISADIVAQLFNSHVASRAKALETIDKHNKLARRYNAKCLELTEAKEANAEKESLASSKDGMEAAEKLHSKPTKPAVQVSEDETSQPAATDSGLKQREVQQVVVGEMLAGDISQLQDRLQQLTAQNRASEQKIANLRTQLGRAHHSLEDLRGNASPSRQS